jgi:tRNA-2-methylthio-N6-dimethylallyladenosine synthase
VREIGLLGQIVDRFGMDLPEGQDLAWLLREVAKIDGIWRVRFLTSHPMYMTDDLIDAVAEDPKLMPHFELPFQAGNDRILKEMRRGYTRQEYIDLVAKIRSKIPDAGINTDIIVGYPTETREEFMDTFTLLEETRLDMAHIAKYSPRPRTLSAKIPDDVTPEEKEERRKLADDLMEKIQMELNAPLVGQTVEVLVEAFNPKKNNWRGRTPQNKLVFLEDAEDRKGQLVNVKITWAGPYSMHGDLVERVK